MSKKGEGYLMVDHRDSPGISEQAAHNAGLPPGANKGMTELATLTCAHCCRVAILNPLRTRAREWCPHCGRYICDVCGAAMALSGVCRSMDRLVEEVQEAASKGAAAAEIEAIIRKQENPIKVYTGP